MGSIIIALLRVTFHFNVTFKCSFYKNPCLKGKLEEFRGTCCNELWWDVISFEFGFQSLGWKAPKMIFPSHSQTKPCKNLTWEALLEHWLLLKVFACAMYVPVLKLQPPFCTWAWLEGKRRTFVLLQDSNGNFCLSRCFPFDKCESFNFFSLLICVNWVYRVIPGGHTPSAQPQSFPFSSRPSSHLFTWLYWTTVKQLHKQ